MDHGGLDVATAACSAVSAIPVRIECMAMADGGGGWGMGAEDGGWGQRMSWPDTGSLGSTVQGPG